MSQLTQLPEDILCTVIAALSPKDIANLYIAYDKKFRLGIYLSFEKRLLSAIKTTDMEEEIYNLISEYELLEELKFDADQDDDFFLYSPQHYEEEEEYNGWYLTNPHYKNHSLFYPEEIYIMDAPDYFYPY
jgi:hypothetical protein